MRNYNTAVSSELPDCLKTAYSKENEQTGFHRSLSKHTRLPTYSTISPDAPSSFHNSFVSTSVPRYEQTPSPPKFAYEDMSRQNTDKKDFSTIRPREYFDMLAGRNQGVKSRLPYYKEYYKTLRRAGFGIHEGMCTSEIRKRVQGVQRSDSRSLYLSTDSPRTHHHRNPSDSSRYSPKSELKRSFDTPLFVSDRFKVKLPSLRLRPLPTKPRLATVSLADKSKAVMSELDEFDRRRKAVARPKV